MFVLYCSLCYVISQLNFVQQSEVSNRQCATYVSWVNIETEI